MFASDTSDLYVISTVLLSSYDVFNEVQKCNTADLTGNMLSNLFWHTFLQCYIFWYWF